MAVRSKPPDNAHILVINRDAAALALFRDVLEGEGKYQVSTRVYVDHDLTPILNLDADLIILDYMWPDADDGWALLNNLRLNRATAVIPIVLCTGAAREVEGLARHLTSMSIWVVLKPFNLDQLLDTIKIALAATAVDPGILTRTVN